jgi:hypothetical protein
MIDEILTEAMARIEIEEALHPDDYVDVQDLLNDLKDHMRDLITLWRNPTLVQLERLEP